MSNDARPWLMVFCFYFGRWPAWINFFVESCKWNPGIRWRVYTDCGEPENSAGNVDFVPVSFEDYKAHARSRLGVKFDPVDPYKLCDLRPALGYLHEEDAAGYPFFGYGDIDIVFGDLSQAYGVKQFAHYDVISTHTDRLSGHFAVFRNKSALRHAFERIKGYRALLEVPHQTAVEEDQFSHLLMHSKRERILAVERYSTILNPRGWHDGTVNFPERWFWRNGRLTNDRDGDREFLYLHFMRYHSAHWLNDPPLPGETAWVGRDIIHMDWRQAADGFCIGSDGFTPMRNSDAA